MLSLTAVLCWGRPALAELDQSLNWVSVGANVGVSNESDETGLLLGAEVSTGRHKLIFWGGGYVDALYDAGTGRVRFSLGPEVGVLFFGVDGGLMLDVGDGEVRPGFVVRPMIALKFVFPYVRWGRRVGSDESSFSEVGVLLKYPFVD